jgi:hypothetical protein
MAKRPKKDMENAARGAQNILERTDAGATDLLTRDLRKFYKSIDVEDADVVRFENRLREQRDRNR